MKGLQKQSYGFPSECEFPSEFPEYFSQNYITPQQSEFAGNSSSTIIGRIGSPASAFYATELYMGLSQFDFQENGSQQLNNSYQPNGNGPDFLIKNGGLSSSVTIPHTSSSNNIQYIGNLSEREQLLHLKHKLLGDLDDSDRRSPSLPFNANLDFEVIHFISNIFVTSIWSFSCYNL